VVPIPIVAIATRVGGFIEVLVSHGCVGVLRIYSCLLGSLEANEI